MDDQLIKILLVEDNPGDARLVQELLRESTTPRFQLAHVDRLAAGLQRLADEKFEAVLLDLTLPDSQGLATFTHIKTERPNVPIILLTGLDDARLGLRAVREGAQDYLVKGQFEGELLVRAIRYAIERHSLLRDLKQKTHQVQASKRRLHTIIEQNADGIVILDKTETVIYVNPAAETVLGRRADALLGQPFGLPLVAAETTEVDVASGNGNGPGVVAEMRVTNIDWEGQPVFLVSLRDITARRRAAEAERELIRMKEEFIANVSHQLRTPIASIKGFLELLLQGKAKDPETQQEFLTRASQDANRLMALVDELLSIFRLETGHLQLQLEDVDLTLLIAETLQSLQGLASRKGISMEYRTPPTIALLVSADRHWLQQVLINLIGNAIKFSKADQTIVVTGQATNYQVTIKVIDQGPGIPPDALLHLFDKFYQAENSAQQAGGGTGLGLYICSRIIDLHGGQIGVESELGRGSTFFFTLPLLRKRLPRLTERQEWSR